MEGVPKDVIEIIAKELDHRSLCRLACTSKTMKEVCDRERVWRHRLKADFGVEPHEKLDDGVPCKQIYMCEVRFDRCAPKHCEFRVHRASRVPHIDFLVCCVRHGLNLNQDDICGNFPLFDAVHCGNFNNVKFLLDNGADPKTRNCWGGLRNYKHMALRYGYPKIANLFKRRRATRTPTARSVLSAFTSLRSG